MTEELDSARKEQEKLLGDSSATTSDLKNKVRPECYRNLSPILLICRTIFSTTTNTVLQV